MISSQRVDVEQGVPRHVPFDGVAWELDYLGVVEEHHKLEITTPKTSQIVRAKPGATFFFATKGSDGVVAVSIEDARPDTADRVVEPSRTSPAPPGSSSLETASEDAPIGWLVFGIFGVFACAGTAFIARRMAQSAPR